LLERLAESYRNLGRLDEAVKLRAEILEVRKNKSDSKKEDVISAMKALAASYRDDGGSSKLAKLEEAIAFAEAGEGTSFAH
jgi:hypothetical protein